MRDNRRKNIICLSSKNSKHKHRLVSFLRNLRQKLMNILIRRQMVLLGSTRNRGREPTALPEVENRFSSFAFSHTMLQTKMKWMIRL
jgi:hypothetical protein